MIKGTALHSASLAALFSHGLHANLALLGLYESDILTHLDAVRFVEDKMKESSDPSWLANQLATEAIARVGI